jgi:hypothetical protein
MTVVDDFVAAVRWALPGRDADRPMDSRMAMLLARFAKYRLYQSNARSYAGGATSPR